MRAFSRYFETRSYRWYRNGFFILLALILTVSSIPSLPEPDIRTFHFEIRLDYFFHFGQYACLAFLGLGWIFKKKNTLPSGTQLLLWSVILILAGILDEFHQKMIPGRTFNPLDAIMNGSGAIAGAIFTIIFWYRKLSYTTEVQEKDGNLRNH